MLETLVAQHETELTIAYRQAFIIQYEPELEQLRSCVAE